MRGLSWLASAVVLGALAGLQATPPLAAAAPQAVPPPARPAAPQKPGQVPTFRAGVNYVSVDAIVTDRAGRPVGDLGPGDFEVTEDGRTQKIETFKYLAVDGQPTPGEPVPREIRSEYDEESEAARPDVRLFVIFLDDYHVRRSSAMAVRPALTAFVRKMIGPSDLCAIMYPEMPVSSVLLTRNQDALLSAIQHFEGRKYDYQPRYPFEEQFASYPAATVERIRNEVSLSALESLVTHLGSLREGRKSVILVSEGYAGVLPAQLNDPIASMPGIGNPARHASGLESIDDRTAFFASLDVEQLLRPVYDAANRNNAAIYALDPRGLATSEFNLSENVGGETDRQMLQATLDTLRTLATQTDGRAIVNRNDLDGALQQVVRDASAYYLLGYNSTHTAPDGKFHEIKVRVKRPGVQVRARRGYWALTREELDKALKPPRPPVPTAVDKALESMAAPRRGRYIRDWIGTGRGEGGKTRVTFAWQALPPVPGLEPTPGVSVTLEASRGDRVFYRGAVGAAAQAPAGGGPASGDIREASAVMFDAEPGPLECRIVVKGERGETLDTEQRSVTVPDLTKVQVALSTPTVFASANAKEFRALLANAAPTPTPSREFRRVDRLLVRFEVYAPGSEAPAVTARVLNRLGGGMADLPVRPPQPPGAFYQLDLPLAGFAPGEYLIEVKARSASGEATELVPLKVSG